jgi:RNA-directed DNA polymerase
MTQKERQMVAKTTSSELSEEEILAGASFHDMLEWHGIQWYRTERNVRRLQSRIVKATQEKRWGKVKALQRLLTHSFSGKALAVRRVTENQGKKTPGVDKVIWDTPEKKAQAIHDLRDSKRIRYPVKQVQCKKYPQTSAQGRPIAEHAFPLRPWPAWLSGLRCDRWW